MERCSDHVAVLESLVVGDAVGFRIGLRSQMLSVLLISPNFTPSDLWDPWTSGQWNRRC